MRTLLMLLCGALLLAAACGGGGGDTKQEAKGGTVVTTPSGLSYVDEAAGTGEPIKAGQRAVVHYTGWLDDNGQPGAKFDSSRDRGQPFDFRVGAGEVIKGWDEGVAGMRVGGKRRLTIPGALAYGAGGIPKDRRDPSKGYLIPPNATLIFDVELLQIR